MGRDTSPSTRLHEASLEALRAVIDPEVGLNVVDLGLVYGVEVVGADVHVRLTMTTPACPLGEQIVRDAEDHLRALDGVDEVTVELVWEPAWSPERLSPAGKEQLGWNR
ncbi:MAG: metal-sulfur cluster assembly factor [Myxococcales bacterium]|nr:metal-sulfur cluster assembly factor [Myxococcales bacterium]